VLAALAPLAVFVIWIGLFPAAFLAPAAPAVRESMAASAAAFAVRMETVPSAVVVVNTPHTQPPQTR